MGKEGSGLWSRSKQAVIADQTRRASPAGRCWPCDLICRRRMSTSSAASLTTTFVVDRRLRLRASSQQSSEDKIREAC